MAMTGGTAFPGVRQQAAAQALGAPKVSGQRQQRSTPGARPPAAPRGMPAAPKVGVGITQHQAAPEKPPSQHQAIRQAAATKIAGGGHAKAPAAPRAAPTSSSTAAPAQKYGLNPIHEYATGKYASPKELANIAKEIADREANSNLAPLRQQATETGSAEQNALARNQAMGAAGQQTLAGLQSGEEASAKTGENNAAEAALQAAKAIQSGGQAASMANGGQLGAATAAALGESAQQAGSLGAAASQYQSAMGVSTPAEMSQLRAAAAQRITEGATRLGEGYQVAQQRNAGEQDKIIGREAVEAQRQDKLLGEEQTKDRTALAAVGVKEGTLKATEAKNQITAKGNQEKNQTTRLDAAEKNATTRLGNAEKNQTQIAEKKDWTQIAVDEKNNKAKTEAAAIKAGGHSSAEETKMASQLTAAYGTVKYLLSGAGTKWTKAQIEQALLTGKVGKTGIAKVTSQPLVQAAYELYYNHEINNVTRAQLTKLGWPSYIKPSEVVGLG